MLAAACLAAPAQQNAAPAPRFAGTIEFVEGDAIIDPKAGAFRPVRAGEPVNEGDTVTTFGGAEVHLRMSDAAYLSIRENTKVTLTTYVADGGDGDGFLIELAKGSLRAITGWIGKFNPGNSAFRTPTATIGIRGTDHEPMHLLIGDPRGEPGTYDKVNDGATFMRSGSGTVEVTPNRAAFHGSAPGARPQLLQSVPAFFRPARNEQRFVQRARETAPTIQKLRDTRVQAVLAERARNPAATPVPTPSQRRVEPPAAAPAAKAVAPRVEQNQNQNRIQRPAPAAAKAEAARGAARQAARKAAQKTPVKSHPPEKKHP